MIHIYRLSMNTLVICMLYMLLPKNIEAQASFTPLGIPEGTDASFATGVSDDGKYISLTVNITPGGGSQAAYIWQQGIGFIELTAAVELINSGASDISGDGLILVGRHSYNWNHPDHGSLETIEAFYSFGDTMISMGHGPGAFPSNTNNPPVSWTTATAISRDGITIVGAMKDYVNRQGEPIPVLTQKGFYTQIGNTYQDMGVPISFEPWEVSIMPETVSDDGTIIAGFYEVPLNFITQAFRWESGVFEDLGDLPGGDVYSRVSDMSDDGEKIVGTSATAKGTEYFLWTRDTGIQPISGLSPTSSTSISISGDGEIIVANQDDGLYIVDSKNGARNLTAVLQNEYNIDLTGWSLRQVQDISFDNYIMVGYGVNPDGKLEAFKIVLPVCPNLETGRGTENWINDSGGLFSNPDNWESREIPGDTSTVLIDVQGDSIYTISYDGNITNEALAVKDTKVKFNLGGFDLTLLGAMKCNPALYVGVDDNSAGLYVESGSIISQNDVNISGGENSLLSLSDATLNINQGGLLVGSEHSKVTLQGIFDGFINKTSFDTTFVGFSQSDSGQIQLIQSQYDDIFAVFGEYGYGELFLGSESKSGFETLMIGNNGIGKASITQNSALTTTSLILARSKSSIADLTVDDASFTTYEVETGEGNTTIDVKNSGTSQLGKSIFGSKQGSNTLINVSGSDTKLTSSEMYIGYSGQVLFSISDSAYVYEGPGDPIDLVVLGEKPGSFGSLSVENFGYLNADTLIAGGLGTAEIYSKTHGLIRTRFFEVGKNGLVDANVIYLVKITPKSILKTRYQNSLDGLESEQGIVTESLILNDSSTIKADSLIFEEGAKLGGNGIVNFNIINTGIISPGHEENKAGKLKIHGNYQQLTSGTLKIDLAGQIPGVDYDLLSISGNAKLGGVLELSSIPDSVLSIGQSFEIINADTISGSFENIVTGSEFETSVAYTSQKVIVTISNITSIEPSDEIESVNSFHLSQNYPNPFNPTTKIKYTIQDVGTSLMKFVQLRVYDILGNEVVTLVNEEIPAGNYEIEFNAENLPTGVYFYRLTAGKYSTTKKLMLIK